MFVAPKFYALISHLARAEVSPALRATTKNADPGFRNALLVLLELVALPTSFSLPSIRTLLGAWFPEGIPGRAITGKFESRRCLLRKLQDVILEEQGDWNEQHSLLTARTKRLDKSACARRARCELENA